MPGLPISIEFDDLVFQLQRFGGISEYWRELTTRIDAMSEFAVCHRSGTRWARMSRPRSPSRVFHSSYYRTARGLKVSNVSTVHDLAYELGWVGSGLKARLHRLEHRRAYFSSDALVCISENTRKDLLTVYPALAERCRIAVVPHGIPPLPDPAPPRLAPGQVFGDRRYVLFVGQRGSYKNFVGALSGFAESGLQHQGFVLACTGAALSEDEQVTIAKLDLRGKVLSLGQVSRAELSYLYQHAHCLVYPSRFEGFGLPILEAMTSGCPVVAADNSAIPEVAGGAAWLVEGTDAAAIGKALVGLCEAQARSRYIARGHARAAQFSWQRSADGHAAIYRQLA